MGVCQNRTGSFLAAILQCQIYSPLIYGSENISSRNSTLLSTTKMNPTQSNTTVNKRVTFFDQNKLPTNYRLLHQLYHSTVSSNGNDEELWKTIANSYNFVMGAEYSWKELNTIWDRAPELTKRKIGSDYVEAVKKPKNNSSTKKYLQPMVNQSSDVNVDEKQKLSSILKTSNSVQSKQVLANNTLDSSVMESKGLKIPDKVVYSDVVLSEDKSIQTDFVDLNDELAQRDLKLKISIQELKLKFLQSQYRRRFGDFGN